MALILASNTAIYLDLHYQTIGSYEIHSQMFQLVVPERVLGPLIVQIQDVVKDPEFFLLSPRQGCLLYMQA